MSLPLRIRRSSVLPVPVVQQQPNFLDPQDDTTATTSSARDQQKIQNILVTLSRDYRGYEAAKTFDSILT